MAIEERSVSYKVWSHPSPRAALLLIHGLGANPTWWESFASVSRDKGFSSYAIDLRQHKSFAEFFDAINKLIEKIRQDAPEKKVIAIGESMGAIIILSMALANQALFAGLICIAPAFNSKTPLKPLDYLKIFLPLFYDRNKIYKLPVTPDMCTRDPNYLKMIEYTYDRDVSSTSQVLFDIFVRQIYMRSSQMRIDSSLLFLVAGDDRLVYPQASVKVFGKLKCADKTLIEYPGMYHALSIELGKEKVFQDIFSWLDKRFK